MQVTDVVARAMPLLATAVTKPQWNWATEPLSMSRL
jgi:hypothetical protein